MTLRSFAVAASALIAAACSPPRPSTDADAASAPRQVVEALFAAFNQHDAAAMAALYAPDTVLTTSERCGPLQGRAALEHLHTDLFAAIPDVQDEVTDYFVDGDRVAVRFVSRSSIPGREFETTFADFFVVRDGLIVSDDTIYNTERPCVPDAAPNTD